MSKEEWWKLTKKLHKIEHHEIHHLKYYLIYINPIPRVFYKVVSKERSDSVIKGGVYEWVTEMENLYGEY